MKLKTITTAAALAVALTGASFAQTAESNVVGYETLTLDAGFNFVGLRLHQNPVASGTLDIVTSTTVEDTATNLGALMTGPTFILEIEDGSGIIQEVTTAAGNGVTVAADLTGLGTPLSYTLRPADTLASTFGTTAPGLTHGFFGAAGADQIWLWNGAGFDQYYYDDNGPKWEDVNDPFGAGIDPATIDLVYADGFVINSPGGSLVVDGDLKSGATELNLVSGFNFVSSIAPEGATLATAFGATAPGLTHGFFGAAGADQIWIWNGAGFDQYYYDDNGPKWEDVNDPFGAGINPATVGLPSGYIINSPGGDVTQGVPVFYGGL
jgi:hypothetical protein